MGVAQVRVAEDKVVGRHVFANLYDIDPKILGDEELLRNTCIKAAKVANMNILDIKSWKVGGKKGGVSVVILVVESHIALHTWVEYRYATLDIYTCGDRSDPWRAFDYILGVLKPKRYKVWYADRSSDT